MSQTSPLVAPAQGSGAASIERYEKIRSLSERLCAPLAIEDYVIQSIPEASPPKWHLAHTTWFFETFVLRRWVAGYTSVDERYRDFFNSYYVHVGDRVPQARRGTFSRPTVEQILAYRASVDDQMRRLIKFGLDSEQFNVIELGLHHEQQHQELLVMDIKSHLAQSPFYPAYQPAPPVAANESGPMKWRDYPGGLVEIGYRGQGFCYDNETPRHHVYLEPFELCDRTVTNAEWFDFINDGGYRDARLWLSDGWKAVQENNLRAPLYWHCADGQWHRFTLHGLVPVEPEKPVTHVSFYEADAYARWCGARLPREIEWEAAAQLCRNAPAGAMLEDGILDPVACSHDGPRALAGNVWEWTASGYESYPGYEQPPAALGEYNGKFMVNQKVLRGGCCATPGSHYRHTYRNFFYPDQRWPFTGVRLAR